MVTPVGLVLTKYGQSGNLQVAGRDDVIKKKKRTWRGRISFKNVYRSSLFILFSLPTIEPMCSSINGFTLSVLLPNLTLT
jgi:hypothetical protein